MFFQVDGDASHLAVVEENDEKTKKKKENKRTIMMMIEKKMCKNKQFEKNEKVKKVQNVSNGVMIVNKAKDLQVL